jgi:hypothetical protein
LCDVASTRLRNWLRTFTSNSAAPAWQSLDANHQLRRWWEHVQQQRDRARSAGIMSRATRGSQTKPRASSWWRQAGGVIMSLHLRQYIPKLHFVSQVQLRNRRISRNQRSTAPSKPMASNRGRTSNVTSRNGTFSNGTACHETADCADDAWKFNVCWATAMAVGGASHDAGNRIQAIYNAMTIALVPTMS